MVAVKSFSGDFTRLVETVGGSHREWSGDGDIFRGPLVPVQNIHQHKSRTKQVPNNTIINMFLGVNNRKTKHVLPHMMHFELFGQFWYVHAAQDHLASARASMLDEASSFTGELAVSSIFMTALNCSCNASTAQPSVALSQSLTSPEAKQNTPPVKLAVGRFAAVLPSIGCGSAGTSSRRLYMFCACESCRLGVLHMTHFSDDR